MGNMAKPARGALEGDFVKIGALRIGRTAKSISVDGAALESPRNVYDADITWIEMSRGGTVSIFFAKLARGRESLKSRIEIRYPPEDFFNHFWNNSRDFHERLRDFVHKWPVPEPPPNVEDWPADKDHSEWVNFDYMAHSGTEGTIDFYHMPPSGIARYAQIEKPEVLELNPVVRVLLTSAELLRLLDRCEPIAREIDSILPAEQRQTPTPTVGRERN
jgi:hypothetical protein